MPTYTGTIGGDSDPLYDLEAEIPLSVDGDASTIGLTWKALRTLADYSVYASQNMRIIYVHSSFAGLPAPFYTQITSACAYAATLASVMPNGFAAKIVVLGNITEAATPVTVPVSGLIVEGSNSLVQISWSTADALFDLNGHNDCIFADFTGNYTGAASGGAANVLVKNNGSSNAVQIRSCRMVGHFAEGLTVAANLAGLTGSIVSGCDLTNPSFSPIPITLPELATVKYNRCGLITTADTAVISSNFCAGISTTGVNSRISYNQVTGAIITHNPSNMIIANVVSSFVNVATGAAGKDHVIAANNVTGKIRAAAGDADPAPTPTVCADNVAARFFDAAPGAAATQNAQNTKP